MKNIALKIMYDGTAYHGWQFQKNAVTVQERMEKVISELTGEDISVTGSSRTDSGVHALEYVLNFKSDTKIPLEKLPYALNHLLRDDSITVISAQVAGDDFNARFSSSGKRYVYKIWNSNIRNPFTSKYTWFFPMKLDIKKMEKAAKHFVGTHDFSAFMAAGGSQKTTVRTIRDIAVIKSPEWEEQIEIEVEADAFLYNMVRIIAGTLTDVGLGKIDPDDIPKIIRSCDRKMAGLTAPPEGLFLKKVFYK